MHQQSILRLCQGAADKEAGSYASNVTAIEHTIDTGDNKPVKQRMRSTPVGFEKEEEHIYKKC